MEVINNIPNLDKEDYAIYHQDFLKTIQKILERYSDVIKTKKGTTKDE